MTLAVNARLVNPSMAADGKRLLATTETDQHEIWTVPLGPDPEANGRAAVRLLDGSGDPFWTQVSRDGSTLLFNSSAAGSRNLWTMHLDGPASPRQITFMSSNALTHSALSPDGTRVAYASHQTGVSKIWAASIDGSDAVQLTDGPAQDFWPTWSADADGSLSDRSAAENRSSGRCRAPAARPSPSLARAVFEASGPPSTTGSSTGRPVSLQVCDADSGKVLLTVPAGDLTWTLPTWSPDGRFFSAMREESRETVRSGSSMRTRASGDWRRSFPRDSTRSSARAGVRAEKA